MLIACQVHLMTLCKSKVSLPKESQLALIHALVAAVDIETCEPSAVFDILNLDGYADTGDRQDDVVPEDKFDPLEPSLASVFNLTGGDVKEFFTEDVVGRKLVGLLQKQDAGLSKALSFSEAGLEYFKQNKDTINLLPRQVSWDSIMKVFRCIIALASPVPLRRDSSKEDVQAILEDADDVTMSALFDEGGTTIPQEEVEMLAGVKSALVDSPFWNSKIGKYWKSAVADAAIGPELAHLTWDMATSGNLDILQKAVDRLPEFRTRLRAGATTELESLVVKGIQNLGTVSHVSSPPLKM